MINIGTVITTYESPTPSIFHFVLIDQKSTSKIPIRKGQYCMLDSEEGRIIAQVVGLLKTNRYYSHPQSVREYERNQSLSSIFPVDRWEYIMAEARSLGMYRDSGIFEGVSFPVSPGEKVYLADPQTLTEFLGLDEKGLLIGHLMHHDIPVNLNMTRLLQKHVAILAMSGAGKSYFSSVLAEELLTRKPEQGRPFVIIVDVHGEYIHLADDELLKDKINVIRSPYVQIATPLLSSGLIAELQPNITPAQVRELNRIITSMKKAKRPYTLADIINEIKEDTEIKTQTKDALAGWLFVLEDTNLFGYTENPDLTKIAALGKAMIIDLSETLSLVKKQLIVTYLARRLFYLRKDDLIPPFVMVLEEAHQFCPEARLAKAISRPVLETIAREGRKFYASLCLISQRPVRLSTTVLSQCNTHIIMKITNPHDLRHIAESSEGIDRSVLDEITSLNVGSALIVGSAVNRPIFVKVRKRMTKEPEFGMSLEEATRKFLL